MQDGTAFADLIEVIGKYASDMDVVICVPVIYTQKHRTDACFIIADSS